MMKLPTLVLAQMPSIPMCRCNITDVSPNDAVCRFSHGIGHYTQVVWAESEEVGCAVVYYKVGRPL